jgi:steroid delta-isomerase
MGMARDVAKQSMALTEARDRDGWLALFADDAVVEDPVGPSMLDPEGKGRRGKAAITEFYDNVITTSEKIEFTIRDSYECGSEVANVGQIVRITLPGNQIGIVPIVNIYKGINDAGKLVSAAVVLGSGQAFLQPGVATA